MRSHPFPETVKLPIFTSKVCFASSSLQRFPRQVSPYQGEDNVCGFNSTKSSFVYKEVLLIKLIICLQARL